MKKKFIFFTALILCLAFAEPALAADDMTAGTWVNNPRYITFGDHHGRPLVWRVLEVKDEDPDFDGIKTAFLLLDDVVRGSGGLVEFMRFDRSNNDFPNSEIRQWLNDDTSGFLAALSAYKAYMLDTTYASGNPPRLWPNGVPEGTSKVFLLSVEEALDDRYFADNADRAASSAWWWLRSPGFEDDIATLVLHSGDIARNGFYIRNPLAVRPALKIDLSPSSVFAAVPVSHVSTVKAIDENAPVRGAKVTLAPVGDAPLGVPLLDTPQAQIFSNSVGVARFTNVTPGEYAVTISKPGYATESWVITVPAPATPALSLTHDPDALPGRVIFGSYNGRPIEWDVLDIVDNRALLLAGALWERHFDFGGNSAWESSSLREYLNSDIIDENRICFLHEINFTAAETAAMDAGASPTGDAVFLLSSWEVFHYMPDAEMRSFGDISWLTRSPAGGDSVVAVNSSGELSAYPVLSRSAIGWTRPAVWVDLNMLTFDRDTNTLLGIEEIGSNAQR